MSNPEKKEYRAPSPISLINANDAPPYVGSILLAHLIALNRTHNLRRK